MRRSTRSRGFIAGAGGHPPVHALGPIDLDLRKGEFFAVVGPSGCGKSTFLEVLAGLQTPSAGTVTFEGKPISGEVADGIGVVFQEDASFPWLTVWDNAAFGLRRSGVRARRNPAPRRRCARLHGAEGLCRGLSVATLRRHAPARLHRAHAGAAAAPYSARRAVRRARCADAAADGRRSVAAVARNRRDGAADHPRARRSRHAVRPDRRHVGAARPLHRDHRNRLAARAQFDHRRRTGFRRNHRPAVGAPARRIAQGARSFRRAPNRRATAPLAAE